MPNNTPDQYFDASDPEFLRRVALGIRDLLDQGTRIRGLAVDEVVEGLLRIDRAVSACIGRDVEERVPVIGDIVLALAVDGTLDAFPAIVACVHLREDGRALLDLHVMDRRTGGQFCIGVPRAGDPPTPSRWRWSFRPDTE